MQTYKISGPPTQRIVRKANHLPPDKSGVPFHKKEEKDIMLYTNNFLSFPRRGVMPEGS
jgi:hypothetical protein